MIKERYLGVDVCNASMEDVLLEIDGIVKNKLPSLIVAINPEKIMKAQQDENLKNMLNTAAIQIPDGIGVVIASKINGGKIKKRVTGIDLMNNICKHSKDAGYKIFMLGAKPGVADKAANILRERYEGINIVGTRDGYFKDNNDVAKDIINSKADVLFIAMGSPKQEYWIVENKDKLGIPVCMGVGGSYDVICGNIKRAPEIMCKIGLEWLYRLIKEPWRIKRMIVIPKFLFKILIERGK